MEHLEFRDKWKPIAEEAESKILAEISRLPDTEFRALSLSKLAGKLTPDGLQEFREIERARVLQSKKRTFRIRQIFLSLAIAALISATFIFYFNLSALHNSSDQSRVGKTVTPISNGLAVVGFESLEDARTNNMVSGHVSLLRKGKRFYVLQDLGDVLEISDQPLNSGVRGDRKWVLSQYVE